MGTMRMVGATRRVFAVKDLPSNPYESALQRQ